MSAFTRTLVQQAYSDYRDTLRAVAGSPEDRDRMDDAVRAYIAAIEHDRRVAALGSATAS